VGGDLTAELAAGVKEYFSAAPEARRLVREAMIANLERRGVADAARRIDDAIERGASLDGARQRRKATRSSRANGADSGYVVEGGRMAYRASPRHGAVPLANFNAKIIEHRVLDDGAEETGELLIEGSLADGRKLPTARVRVSHFGGMTWPVAAWGPRAVVSAGYGSKDRLREAIQVLSGDIPEHRIFAHTGWRRISGAWLYLHAGGAVGPRGPASGVAVELLGSLGSVLLRAPTSRAEACRAVAASLEILDVAPHAVTVPLLGAAYLAPLRELLEPEPPDLTVWFHGGSGVGKSELVALAQSHFGHFSRTNLPVTFGATANGLERILFSAKDVLVAVDDYHPTTDPREERAMAAVATRLLRSTGNVSGRQRMRADTSLRPELRPRALVVATGERIPAGHSTVARMFSVPVDRGTVDLRRLTSAQEARSLYPVAMTSYIQSIAERWGELAERLRRRFRELRDRAQAARSAHGRAPGQVAYLCLGLEEGVEHAVAVGALDRAAADEMTARAWEVLIGLAHEHGDATRNETPTALFVALLADGLAGKRVYLESLDGGAPDDGPMFGWDLARDAAGCPDYRRPVNALRLGWVDGAWLYLLPELTNEYVTEAARRSGRVFPVEQRTLLRRLAEDRLIACEPGGRRTPRQRIPALGGSQVRVIKLRRDALSPMQLSAEDA